MEKHSGSEQVWARMENPGASPVPAASHLGTGCFGAGHNVLATGTGKVFSKDGLDPASAAPASADTWLLPAKGPQALVQDCLEA